MEESVNRGTESLEFELRGGWWEGIHAVLFYGSVVCGILATLGVARLATESVCVFLIFYTIFAIVSSPAYAVIDPATREVRVERYHYFLPSRRTLKRDELERIEVVEAPRLPSGEGRESQRRDLSYYVRVYLKAKDGRRFKIFRSNMAGSPSENREKAFLVTQSAASILDLPVLYATAGKEKGKRVSLQGKAAS